VYCQVFQSGPFACVHRLFRHFSFPLSSCRQAPMAETPDGKNRDDPRANNVRSAHFRIPYNTR